MVFASLLSSSVIRLQSLFSHSKHLRPSNCISEESIARYCIGGYHPTRIGDLFNHDKYKILSKLGYGVYSTVWLALDLELKRHVALKILTADSFGQGNDTFELDILRRIKPVDIKPQNILVESPAINKMFQQAPSEAFQRDGSSLKPPNDFYVGSTQVSSAQEDLTCSTDLSVRLADFGTASWFDKHLTEWIQPQMLRAPEVILGADWDYKVDIWNLGLIIWELAEGKLLFDGMWTSKGPYTPEAHLAQITAVFGGMPKHLLDRSKNRDRYFDADGIDVP
ncbi:hypothetical protein AK830_g11315 [Neonectria ditissima]|uniref:non-specific serine/threonine protein kinase n=1 Tax=Neonectria ditissima TaxID=78410 RepID=A0A0N8H559_9HYPO|nr:hypothetical protein AK830_g11315 [Neonectria ditissima]